MKDSCLPRAQHLSGTQYGDKLVQVASLYTVAAVCEGQWMQLLMSTAASLGPLTSSPSHSLAHRLTTV